MEIEPESGGDLQNNDKIKDKNNENVDNLDNKNDCLNNTAMNNDEVFMPNDDMLMDTMHDDMLQNSIDLMDQVEDVNIDIVDQNDKTNDDLAIVDQNQNQENKDKNKKKTQVLAIN